MAPKYINIFRATIFISLFCIVSTPWNIIKNASGLLAFLSGYSCLMGPLAGEWMLFSMLHDLFTDIPDSIS